MLCGSNSIVKNIPIFKLECEKYFVNYSQPHITLLWIWIILCPFVYHCKCQNVGTFCGQLRSVAVGPPPRLWCGRVGFNPINMSNTICIYRLSIEPVDLKWGLILVHGYRYCWCQWQIVKVRGSQKLWSFLCWQDDKVEDANSNPISKTHCSPLKFHNWSISWTVRVSPMQSKGDLVEKHDNFKRIWVWF